MSVDSRPRKCIRGVSFTMMIEWRWAVLSICYGAGFGGIVPFRKWGRISLNGIFGKKSFFSGGTIFRQWQAIAPSPRESTTKEYFTHNNNNLIVIIIIWFSDTVTLSYLTKCNTNSKVRAISDFQTILTCSSRGPSTWHSLIHTFKSANTATV